MNLPNTSIFPLGIGVSVDVSLFQLHLLYFALPCYRAVQPYMYLGVHVHVLYWCTLRSLLRDVGLSYIHCVLSEPLCSECSEHSAAHPARCGKYRGISNYLVVSLLHWGEPPGNYNPWELSTRNRKFQWRSRARRLRQMTSSQYLLGRLTTSTEQTIWVSL